MNKLYSKNPFLTLTLSVIFGVLAVVTVVSAATTISTNIVTEGNLTVTGTVGVTGVTTLVNASTTRVSIGSSGTTVTQLIKGFCTSWNGTGLNSMDGNHTASTTEAYDCAVTGVVSGDMVMAQLSTSTPFVAGSNNLAGDWAIVGAKASTTAGYITILLWNGGATSVPSSTGIGSSTAYLIIR
ncbi:MAG: hypothetical protein AAB637_00885 [Patescibacteria group bacterium]